MNSTTDELREQNIRCCGDLMRMAFSRWEWRNNPDDLAEAKRWLALMELAIAQRSPEMVAKLEEERGLTG